MTALSATLRGLFPVPPGMFTPRGNKPAFAAIVIDAVGTGLFMSLSLLYLHRVNGVDPAVAGPVVTGAALASFLLMAPISAVVHRLRGRNSLLLAAALGAVGHTAYLWAKDPATVAVAAFLVALGDRLTGTCWPVLAAERFGRGRVRSLFAVANSAKTFALAAGALVASFALAAGGDRGLWIMLLANIATFILTFAVLCTVSSGPGGADGSPLTSGRVRMSDVLRNRRFMSLVVSQTALSATWMIPMIAFPLYFTLSLGESAALATAALAIRYIVVTVAQVPLVHRVAGWSLTTVLLVSAASAALGVLVVASLPLVDGTARVVAVVAATVLIAGSEICSKPIASAEAVRVAPPGTEAPFMAVFQVTWSLAYVLGPAVVGVGLSRPVVLWCGLLAVVVLGTVVGRLLGRERDAGADAHLLPHDLPEAEQDAGLRTPA